MKMDNITQSHKIEQFEQEPFLNQPNQDLTSSSPSTKDRQHIYRRYRIILLHICLILLYSTISFLFVNRQECRYPGSYNIFPSQKFKYEPKLFSDSSEDGFADSHGDPSAEVDERWHKLMMNISIRVSEKELKRNGQTSVELPNGGHLAWLEVYHSLHCLKRLRKWNHRQYYYPNLLESSVEYMMSHVDHCIERVRQAVMCLPDLSLTTFEWTENNTTPMLNTYKAPHTCVDWGHLMHSIKDRIVDPSELDSMVNPNLVVQN